MATHRTFIATYIMANRRNGAVYVGMTANLHARVWKHKNGTYDGHTEEHGCDLLVWYEQHQWVVDAIRREKRLKKWLRDWKLKLIEDVNPRWLDLAADWYPVNDPDWIPTGSRRSRKTDYRPTPVSVVMGGLLPFRHSGRSAAKTRNGRARTCHAGTR